jgi:hypothetical protein
MKCQGTCIPCACYYSQGIRSEWSDIRVYESFRGVGWANKHTQRYEDYYNPE